MKKKSPATDQALMSLGFNYKRPAPIEEQIFDKPDIESFIKDIEKISDEYRGELVTSSWNGRGTLVIKNVGKDIISLIIIGIYDSVIAHKNNVSVNIRISRNSTVLSVDFTGKVANNVIKL